MNSITLKAFADELEKIAALPGKSFALAGARAITHTPASAVKGFTGSLRGEAGNLVHTIRHADSVAQAARTSEEARHAFATKMLQSGEFNPKIHDANELMRSGRIIPRRPSPTLPTPAPVTKVIPKEQVPIGTGPEGTQIFPAYKPPVKPVAPGAAPAPVQQGWRKYIPHAAIGMGGLGTLGLGYELGTA